MKLTPPTNVAFWIATVLFALGFLGQLGVLSFVAAYAFWLVVVGFVVLWLGNVLKGF